MLKKRGFDFNAEGVNKLDAAYGAFNFNLVLAMQSRDLENTAFSWTADGQQHHLRLSDQFNSFFRLPAVAELVVEKPDYSLSIGCEPGKTAGFYVDWGSSRVPRTDPTPLCLPANGAGGF